MIPEGWEARAFAGRVIASGACSYKELVDGSITLREFFTILQMLDWNDYVEKRRYEAARKEVSL